MHLKFGTWFQYHILCFAVSVDAVISFYSFVSSYNWDVATDVSGNFLCADVLNLADM